MHTRKSLGIYVAALAACFAAFFLLRHRPVNTTVSARITVYDHCQYLVLVFETGDGYSFSITHKGNCTNSIHRTAQANSNKT